MDLFAISARVAAEEQTGVVRKTPGKGYCVKSEKNPDWSGGCYPTKGEADDRLEQVEAAKHAKASSGLSMAEAEFVASYCDMILSSEPPSEFRIEILHDLLSSYNSGSE
jgi:hypothetical protein